MNEDEKLTININRRVELELVYTNGEHESMSFDLVTDDQADYYEGFLGVSTPLGKALFDQAAGSVISYHAGDIREVRIVSVTISTRLASDRASEREQVIRKAVAESELRNRIAVATAVDNKWGDYDPVGLQQTLDEVESKNSDPKEKSEV